MGLGQNEIGNTLLRSMIETLEEKGTINIEDVSKIFQDIALSVKAEDPRINAFVRSEITKLATFIAEAKNEIFEIVPDAGGEEEFFNAAGEELNAVVRATEEATDTILDSTDAILNAANSLSDKKTKTTITDASNRIYNACTFQDITGQRINKVIKTMEYVEAKVAKLAKLFGSDNEDVVSIASKDSKAILHDKRPDAHLMEGPQLDGNAQTQDEIDALFGS